MKGDFNSLSKGLADLGLAAEDWSDNLMINLVDALHQIGQAWAAGAKRRCPVDNGTLRNSISYHVAATRKGVALSVGVPRKMQYAIFVEFGTEHIAGGRVKALGTSPEISDAQAIHDWPAKAAESNAGSYGAGGEQMPWLRTSYTEIKDKAESLIYHAVGYEV